MALAANDVLHKFYWVRIPVVHGVSLDPMQCLAKSPKVDPMEYLSGRFVLQRVDAFAALSFGVYVIVYLLVKLFVDGVPARWRPKKCAPMRRSNACHGLQSSVGFGPHMRGPASTRLTRTLRGAYADAPLYDTKFCGSSSSSRNTSRSSSSSSSSSSSM